ncbi:translation initiation factor IF-6 [Candidatus Micrarchaeota archaeon]|nr:translation initiation factor IF-6 [Candidatus Micrarchaeota archaeon]
MSFKINKTSIQRNPFIGLFLKTNNEFTLVPRATDVKIKELVEETLNTQAIEVLINESGLLGLFSSMNSKGIVLPSFVEEPEKKLFKKLGLNIVVFSKSYSPGNNLLVNDKVGLVSMEVPDHELKQISDGLGIELFRQPLAGIPTVGSHNVATNKGLLLSNDTSQIDLKYLEKIFSLRAVVGSTNLGAGGNALGLVANDHGALTGDLTSGFEVQRIYEAFNE